jgi:hypothetical protein
VQFRVQSGQWALRDSHGRNWPVWLEDLKCAVVGQCSVVITGVSTV